MPIKRSAHRQYRSRHMISCMISTPLRERRQDVDFLAKSIRNVSLIYKRAQRALL